MTHRALTAALLLGTALAVSGCATTDSGIGSAAIGNRPVFFRWKSSGRISGSMTAALPGGATYSGRYFQITSATRLSGLGPLWVGWDGDFGMEEDWGMDNDWNDWNPGPQFMTHYSGRVVANLAAADGARMRCRFRLIHPADGMAGGGRGACQLPDGSRIDAQFPST